MRTRTLVSILTFLLAVLLNSSCATIPKTQEERGVVDRKEFFRAVKSGDVDKVIRKIDEGADVNAQDKEGLTALMIASQKGYTIIARLLLQEGADVDAQNMLEAHSFYNWREKYYFPHFTALMYASSNGHTETVKLLIEAGAYVDRKSAFGGTALIYALRNGHTEIVKLLIDEGADVNVRDNAGWTALMDASHKGHTEVAKLLIEAGADVNTEDNEGHTVLMAASYEGHTEVAKILIEEGADVNAKTLSMSDYYEVCWRAPRGLLDEIRGGYTALMYASREGHTEIVKLLMESGAK